MSRRCRLLLLASTCVLARPAQGQLCAGLPSLRERPVRVEAEGLWTEGAWGAAAGATAGRTVFGSAHFGRVTYDDVDYAAMREDAQSTTIGAAAGVELSLPHGGANPRYALCPVVTAEWETGPDGDFGSNHLDSDGWSVGGGVSLGGQAFRSGRVRLIPHGGVSFVRVEATVHDVPFEGTDTRAHDTGWLFELGVGIVLGSVTVSPAVTIPAGIAETDPTIRLGASVGFGSARH